MKIKGYECLDKQCPKRWCWSPGEYQHRGATSSGSQSTGAKTKTCMERAYRGCPQPLPEPGDSHPWEKEKPV